MIRSMTGFGKGREIYGHGKIEVEIKTLNYKNLNLTCNPVNDFFLLEQKMQKIVGEKIFRGKVFIKVTKEIKGNETTGQKLIINETVAKRYLRKIKGLQKQLNIKGNIEIKDLVSYPGVMEIIKEKKEETAWPYIQKAAIKALNNLVLYRKAEGSKLAKDFKKRLINIEKYLKGIKKYSKQSINNHRKKLIQATKEMPISGKIDKMKLGEEVALFARNCDVTEEIVRLEGHVSAYRQTINKAKKDAGKKLDFIAQEMQRETNTIGAKSSDFRVSEAVIEIKSEIEKIREQIRNIE